MESAVARLLVGLILVPVSLTAACALLQATETNPVDVEPVPLDTLKARMLELISENRAAHGLSPVDLGENRAAQQHAKDMLAHGYLSHWGRDGLKPYMRYTRAGGHEYVVENVSGPACVRHTDRLYDERLALELVEEAQAAFMASSGHRANVLGRWHKAVSLGIACDSVSCSIVQLFEGDYVRFAETPRIFIDKLSMAGRLLDGFELEGVAVWYDEPPHSLTLGQLGHSHSYSVGQRPVALLRPPAGRRSLYANKSIEATWERDSDPYEVDADVPPPASFKIGLTQYCSDLGSSATLSSADVPLVTTSLWDVSGSGFAIEADLGEVLGELGPGVYTVVIMGTKDGDAVELTNYSIFQN